MTMDDRGEKIITLAREMLRSDMRYPSVEQDNGCPISFRMLCLATMLAAFGGSAVTEWAGEGRRPINHYEKTELNALIFYAARLKNLDEQGLRRDVAEQLKVASLNDLTRSDFLVARRYLQDKAE